MKPGTLPSSDRRLPVPPVVRLEGQGCGVLGGGSLEGGVCDSLSHTTSSVCDSHHPGFVLSPVYQGEGFGRGDTGSSPQGSGGACASNSRLLQPHVHCHQGYGGLASNHRPVHPEPECGPDSFSDGDLSDGSSLCSQERLDGLHRSEGCASQTITYLGIRIFSQTFTASATPLRIEKFFSIAEEFLSSKVQSAKFWRVLLGHLASLSRLVPNSQLRMRALQLALSRGWDFRGEDILVPWDPPSRDDLQWWCTEGRLEEGISLALRTPDQLFWSDAFNLGWGATVEDQFASGVWLEGEASLSINNRELFAVERGLRALCACLEGRVVAVFSDNTTVVAYLRRQEGTLSPSLNAVAQRILCWTEQLNIILMPQFVPGRNNVVADALSRPNQVLGSELMLHQEVFNWLRQRWPVTIDLFASSLSHRCSVYFAPVSDPMAAGMDAMLHSWDSLQAYAFPPFAMISQVLAKVRASQGLELMLIALFWPQRPWFLELLILPPLPLPSRWDFLRQPHVRRFHQNLSMLCLHAWRLSGDSREPPASLVAWLDDLGR